MGMVLRDVAERPIPFPAWRGVGGWGRAVDNRPKLTAKGLRALGRPVPSNIPDRECVVLVRHQEA